MREIIVEELRRFEREMGITILYAVEAGSRAWGYSKPDSDYDVRFMYVKPLEKYLSLNPNGDVLEQSTLKQLDFVGWDIQKALKLFHGSNPSLMEWLTPENVYLEEKIIHPLRKLLPKYYSRVKCLHHYYHMAKRNYTAYIQSNGNDIKSMVMTIRPLLACEWIMGSEDFPPNQILTSANEIIRDEEIQYELHQLIKVMQNGKREDTDVRFLGLHHYIEMRLTYIEKYISTLPDYERRDWSELNAYFLRVLKDVWG